MTEVDRTSLTESDIEFLTSELATVDTPDCVPRCNGAISTLADAWSLAAETGVSSGGLYAIGRSDLDLSRETLTTVEIDAIEDVLSDAIACDVVNPDDDEMADVGTVLEQIRTFRLRASAQSDERTRQVPSVVTGQVTLTDADTRLPGQQVRITDQDGTTLAKTISDESGQFQLTAPSLEAGETVTVAVRDAAGQTISQRDLDWPGEGESKQLDLTTTGSRVVGGGTTVGTGPGERVGSVSLDSLTSAVPDLTDETVGALSERGIEDVTSLLNSSATEEFDFSDDGLDIMRAHANLRVLPTTPETAQTLIDAGITGTWDLPQESPAALYDTLDAAGAAAEYPTLAAAGAAQTYLLDDIFTGMLADRASGILDDGDLLEEVPQSCACDDCESALGRQAYLADLLKYVTEHVTLGGSTLDAEDLQEQYFQPFGDLPTSCDDETGQIEHRQARLCIDSVLGFLEDEGGIEFIETFDAAATYRKSVYESLLNEIGTSRAELEAVQFDSVEKRTAVADRIGVRKVDLSLLYFDHNRPPASGTGLSERGLEDVFGLRATSYIETEGQQGDPSDPADTTVTRPDPLREIPRQPGQDEPGTPLFVESRRKALEDDWKLQDYPDNPYLTGRRPVIDPDRIGPDEFRTPDPANSTAFELWRKRRLWVDDQLATLRSVGGTNTDHPDVGAMFSRLTGAGTITYDGTTQDGPWKSGPKPGEFSDLVAQLDTETADQARKRIEKLHLTTSSFTRLVELWERHRDASAGGAAGALSTTDWREFRSILVTAIKRSFDHVWQQEEANASVSIGPESFWEPIREPTRGRWSAEGWPKLPMLDPEEVGTDDLPGPTAGETARQLLAARQTQLDDHRSKLRSIWNRPASGNGTRDTALLDEILDTTYGGSPPGNQSNWRDYISTLHRDLTSTDEQTVTNAEQRLETELGLTRATFNKLRTVRSSVGSGTDPPPKQADVTDLLAALTTAWKERDRYPEWEQAEQTEFTTSNGDLEYWRLRKARLPEWRAPQQERQRWLQALRHRAEAPILDPDVVTGEDFRSDVPSALPTMMKNRQQTLTSEQSRYPNVTDSENLMRRLSAIQTVGDGSNQLHEDLANYLRRELSAEQIDRLIEVNWILLGGGDGGGSGQQNLVADLANFGPTEALSEIIRLNELLRDVVGISLAEARELSTDAQGESGIDARLQQLSVSRRALSYLLETFGRLADETRVFQNRWHNVYAILGAVYKRRLFGEWNRKERDYGLILSPEVFESREVATDLPDPGESDPMRWRVSRQSRKAFETTVETRIEQHREVSDSLAAAVDNAERDALPAYRDALVRKVGERVSLSERYQDWRAEIAADSRNGDEDTPPTAAAKWVADGLLVQSRGDGCRELSRVDQAIESLQQLVFSLDTGQPVPHPDGSLAIRDDRFEKSWDWLQSYTRWRAAMAVYLHPENVLRPTLREPAETTPLFSRIAGELRGQHTNSETACDVAETYTHYLRDLGTIEVEATCWSASRITDSSSDCVDAEPDTDAVTRCFYTFGRGETTNHVYWSRFDPDKVAEERSGGEWTSAPDDPKVQSFWQRLDLVGPNASGHEIQSPKYEVLDVVGAVPDGDVVALFLLTAKPDEESGQQLRLVRFNTMTESVQNVTELDVRDDIEDFSATVVQRAYRGDDDRPTVIITGPPKEGTPLSPGGLPATDRVFYHYRNALNEDGTDWQGDWRQMEVFGRRVNDDERPDLRAAVEVKNQLFVFTGFRTESGELTTTVDLTTYSESSRAMNIGEKVLENREDLEDQLLELRQFQRTKEALAELRRKLSYHKDERNDAANEVEQALIDIDGLPFPRKIADAIITFAKNSPDSIDREDWIPDSKYNSLGTAAQEAVDEAFETLEEIRHHHNRVTSLKTQIDEKKQTLDAYREALNDETGSETFDAYLEWRIGFRSCRALSVGRILTAMYWPDAAEDDLGLNLFMKTGGYPEETEVRQVLSLPVFESLEDQGWAAEIADEVSDAVSDAAEAIADIFGGGQDDDSEKLAKFRELDDKLRKQLFYDQETAWMLEFGLPLGGQVDTMPTHAGPTRTGETRYVASATAGSSKYTEGVFLHHLSVGHGVVDTESATVLAPRIGTSGREGFGVDRAPVVGVEFSTDQQHRRRSMIEELFDANTRRLLETTQPRSNEIYLWEAYYFVPIQIANRLRAAGEFEAALDWYRTVYEYSIDDPEKRKIFPHLQDEASNPGVGQRSEDWLLHMDPVNPHGIAITRRNAYTKYTVFSVVQCLLDYGDAEFTRDTVESVNRAETLYRTALELLSVEGLNRDAGTCPDIDVEVEAEEDDEGEAGGYDEGYIDPVQVVRGKQLEETVERIETRAERDRAIAKLREELEIEDGGDDESTTVDLATASDESIDAARETVAELSDRDGTPGATTMSSLIANREDTLSTVRSELMTDPGIAQAVQHAGTLGNQALDLRWKALGSAGLVQNLVTTAEPVETEAPPTPTSDDTDGETSSSGGSATHEDSEDEFDGGAISRSSGADDVLYESSASSSAPIIEFDEAVNATLDTRINFDPSVASTVLPGIYHPIPEITPSSNGESSDGDRDSGDVHMDFPILMLPDPWIGVGWRPPIGNFLYEFCVPENPLLDSLRRHAENNLRKIRNCRNIAGMKRDLEPAQASTGVDASVPDIGSDGTIDAGSVADVSPTEYRYETLIERAKEFVRQAQNLESQVLSAIEKMEQEEYTLMKARQDAEVAQSRVQLQKLEVKKARDRVDLSELQKERAVERLDHYDSLLSDGLLQSEQNVLRNKRTAAHLNTVAAGLYTAAAAMSAAQAGKEGVVTALTLGLGGDEFGEAANMLNSMAQATSSFASVASTWASINATQASYQRRRQRWRHQESLARADKQISDQQITIAEDRVDIAEQSREIAELKAEQTDERIEFLRTQFTNADLYEWMSEVLLEVYRYFLQQATALASLAETQLSFERQTVPPDSIQADYWSAPTEGRQPPQPGSDDGDTDRKGLTASARLKQDIYELDQFAFRTDERRHQVEKTISLRQLDPTEFERLRQSGVMSFSTPMELFDREYPGHYMRMIRNVEVTVVALTPPNDGVNATLASGGVSRVVTGGPQFDTEIIRRTPESIALSSGQSDTGMFQLTPNSEKLLPFEKTGVDTTWQFRMPHAANAFDFDSLVDVLLTVKYTALESHQYRQQTLSELDDRVSEERAFRFSDQLPDQWYTLNNPPAPDESTTVSFRTDREDFAANREDLSLEDVTLMFVDSDGDAVDDLSVTMEFAADDTDGVAGGTAAPADGIISTISGTGGIASGWTGIANQGATPLGEWTLTLPPEAATMLAEDDVEDLLFVVTYEGTVPAYPTEA